VRNLSNFISVASILRLCKAVRVQFSDPYNNVGKTSVSYIFKIVSVLTFLKIVLLIVLTNCKDFANLNYTSLERYLVPMECYLVPTVIHVQSLCSQICVYTHISCTIWRRSSGKRHFKKKWGSSECRVPQVRQAWSTPILSSHKYFTYLLHGAESFMRS